MRARAAVCVLVAAALVAPQLWAGIAAERCERSVQILALAVPNATILANRGGSRVDEGRQRPSTDSPFTLLALARASRDRGRPAAEAEGSRPPLCRAAETRSGRSPPSAIS